MAVDWLTIKTEYINGHIPLRKLAEKHDVSYSQVAKVAASEKWAEQRESQRIKTESVTNQKVVEKISEALSEEAAVKANTRVMLWRMAQNWVSEQEEHIKDVGDFRKIVQSCVDLGIMDVQDTEEHDGDGLIEALTANATELFDDGDDSYMLPEEEGEIE